MDDLIRSSLRDLSAKASVLPPVEQEAVYQQGLDSLLQAAAELEAQTPAWDFSKTPPAFSQDGPLCLRPLTDEDMAIYMSIRLQYCPVYVSFIDGDEERKALLFRMDTARPEAFYCIVSLKDKPIGYVGIKDTREDRWEIAIELDEGYTGKGYGPRSIRLFLEGVTRSTGKTRYRAVIDQGNSRSRRCFERMGAQLEEEQQFPGLLEYGLEYQIKQSAYEGTENIEHKAD